MAAYRTQPAPRRVSTGTVSRPSSKSGGRPRFQFSPANATPKRVSTPRTIA